MLRTNRPRRGLSLVEVLIAMFVMAIGMIAIFTLFPLGAIKIGQALKDDRCSQTATQADAYMRSYWRSEVVKKLTSPVPGLLSGVSEPFYGAIDESNSLVGGGSLPTSIPIAAPVGGYSDFNAPGYPVMIDPLGYESRAGSFDQSVVAYTASAGTSTVRLLPRRQLLQVANAPTPPSTVTRQQAAFRIASMSDDYTFSKNGSPVSYDPVTSLAEPITRQGRYSWAALVQRIDRLPRGTAKLTVMVFDGRPRLPARTPPNGTTPRAYNDELMVYPAANSPAGSRQVTVDVPTRGADDPVLVREGGWVLDGTLATAPASAATPVREAKFYRIVAATEVAANADLTRYTLDLDKPLDSALAAPGAGGTPSNLYFFAGLSEVFERNSLGPDNNN